MNKILEVIYNDYTKRLLPENPLSTTEIENAISSLCDTYFSHMPSEEQDKAYTRLLNLCSAIEQNAFEVGFYAGIKLLANREKF